MHKKHMTWHLNLTQLQAVQRLAEGGILPDKLETNRPTMRCAETLRPSCHPLPS